MTDKTERRWLKKEKNRGFIISKYMKALLSIRLVNTLLMLYRAVIFEN